MKSKRECPECKIKYEPTRRDQIYCGATCRWNACRKRQKDKQESKEQKDLAGLSEPEQKQEPKKISLLDSLRNVPVKPKEETETKQQPTQIQAAEKKESEVKPEIKKSDPAPRIEREEYKKTREKKEEYEAGHKKALSIIASCDQHILELEHKRSSLKKAPDRKKLRRWGSDAEDLFGDAILDAEINYDFNRKELEDKINWFRNSKQTAKEQAVKAEALIREYESKLKIIKQFEEPPKKKEHSLSEIFQSIRATRQAEEVKKVVAVPVVDIRTTQENPIQHETENVFESEGTCVAETNINNPKILSSSQIRGLSYDIFPFAGKWKDFFGTPQFCFHVGVHGRPGEGKSTFCVQFADYLARHFGKVIYISGEEGLAKTVQDKLVNNGINNPHLFFGDIRNYEEITTEIPNEFHFIFIDSLDTLKIDKFRLKALKEHYSDSSFVTISQSTKTGQMRGSLEIMHDNDVMIKVVKGVAITEKNRFHRTGQEFKVFDTLETIQKKNETKLSAPKFMINERGDKLI